MATNPTPVSIPVGLPPDDRLRSPAQITPHKIGAYLLNVLKFTFGDPAQYADGPLAKLMWAKDDTVAQLMTKTVMIRPHYEWAAEDAQQTPSILVRRGGFRGAPLGVGGDRYQFNSAVAGEFPTSDGMHMGHDNGVRSLSGTHSVCIVGQAGGSVEVLSEAVWIYLLSAQNSIRCDMKLTRLTVSGLGELEKFKEFGEAWASVIQISYDYHMPYLMLNESPVMSRMFVNPTIG